MHPKHPGTDVYEAYIAGPEPNLKGIRARASLRAQQSEAEMDCILRRAAALGMQYGEYMIYLRTQKENIHEQKEL